MRIAKECYEQYLTNLGSSTPRNKSRTATYHPSKKKKIQVKRTSHAEYCFGSKDKLISDLLLWTSTHGCASVGRPARNYCYVLSRVRTIFSMFLYSLSWTRLLTNKRIRIYNSSYLSELDRKEYFTDNIYKKKYRL